jgi:zinc transporter ZupT
VADLSPLALVFLAGLVTALATGLGALPFLFVRTVSPKVVAWSNAIAAGLMLGASFTLVVEGLVFGAWQTVVGANLGVGFILLTQMVLPEETASFGTLKGLNAHKALLMVIVMTVHSFSEGVAVGVSFGGGETLAALITIAIAIHNIPEGLAISATMRPRGASIASCAWWSVFSSLPQPLMAVPAFLFVDAFTPVLPYGLGFAAGAMTYMVFRELLPEAYEDTSRPAVGLLVSLAFTAMIGFQLLLG